MGVINIFISSVLLIIIAKKDIGYMYMKPQQWDITKQIEI